MLWTRLAASAGIVTWVATGGNPGNLLGLGGGRSLKRQDMAEKEAPRAFSHVLTELKLQSEPCRTTGMGTERTTALFLLVAFVFFSDSSA